MLHTRNEPLKLNLKTMSAFQAASVPTMVMLKNIISDSGMTMTVTYNSQILYFVCIYAIHAEWFDEHFFPKNHAMLRHAYWNAKNKFSSKGIRTTCSSAGFFFLADFRSFMQPLTNEKCHGTSIVHSVQLSTRLLAF